MNSSSGAFTSLPTSELPDEVSEAGQQFNMESFDLQDKKHKETGNNNNETNENIDNTDIENDDKTDLLYQARSKFKLLPWYKRPSVLMICFLIYCVTFSASFGMTSSIQLLVSGSCSHVRSENDQISNSDNSSPFQNEDSNNDQISCDSPTVQSLTVTLQKWTTVLPGIIKLLVSSKIGKLSDIHGRKPALLFTLLMIALGNICNFLVINPNISNFHPVLFVLASTIESIGGSTVMVVTLGNTYVVDVSEPDEVNKNIGIAIASLYIGIGCGPFLSSLLGGILDSPQLLAIACCLTSLCVLMTWLIFPESRSNELMLKSKRDREEEKFLSQVTIINENKMTKLGNLLGKQYFKELISSMKLLWTTEKDSNGKLNLTTRNNVLILIAISLLISIDSMGLGSVLMLFAVFKFHWTNQAMGQLITVSMLMSTVVLLLVNPKLTDFLNKRYVKDLKHIDKIDIILIFICLISQIIGLGDIILANSTGWFILYSVFSSFGALAGPTFNAAILKYNKNPEKNGEFFGCLILFTNAIGLIAPVFFLSVYQATLEFSPKFVFYIALGIMMLNLGLVMLLKTHK